MSRVLNGTTDYLYYAGTPVTAFPFSYAVWVRFEAIPGVSQIMTMVNTANTSAFQLNLATGQTSRCDRNNANSAIVAQGPPLGIWVLMAAVHSATNSATCYIGINATTNTNNVAFPSGLNKLLIGVWQFNTSNFQGYCNATVARPAIWEGYSLTLTDVRNLCKGYAPSTVGGGALTHYWPLGADLNDAVGSWHLTAASNNTVSTDEPPTIQTAGGVMLVRAYNSGGFVKA